MPRAGHSGWVILLGPVGCFESPGRLVQPPSAVPVSCQATDADTESEIRNIPPCFKGTDPQVINES